MNEDKTLSPGSGRPGRQEADLWLRWGAVVLDLAILAGVLVVPLAWLYDPLKLKIGPARITIPWTATTFVMPVLFAILRLLVTVWGRERRGWRVRGPYDLAILRKLTLAIVLPFLLLLAFDLSLLLLGFKATTPTLIVKGNQGDAVRYGSRGTLPDDELRWKLNPGGVFMGLKINSLGFLDREVDRAKAPGTVRVICMGCSCTAQGPMPYSRILHDMLTNAPPTGRAWEAFNMGVFGYSSVQGLRLFEAQGRALNPDVVTLYFGWNDHWCHGLQPDSSLMALGVSSRKARLLNLLTRKRCFQFMLHRLAPSSNAIRVRFGKSVSHQAGDDLRVPPEEYRLTLAGFIREIRSAGAMPVLLTAPRAETLTDALVTHGQATSIPRVTALHDQYCDITRQVAVKLDVPLVDLAAEFAPRREEPLFAHDGIHLTLTGRRRVAEAIYRKLQEIASAGIPRNTP